MNENNPLYKGSLTTIVLKLLQDQQEMYGYEITRKVKALSAGQVNLTEGALYPALYKLESEGLVSVRFKNFENRQRKYYRLTASGKKEVKNKVLAWQAFVQQMQNLLNLQLS